MIATAKTTETIAIAAATTRPTVLTSKPADAGWAPKEMPQAWQKRAPDWTSALQDGQVAAVAGAPCFERLCSGFWPDLRRFAARELKVATLRNTTSEDSSTPFGKRAADDVDCPA